VKVEASRELLAPVEDVWQLLADPYHLPDWWPGYVGVEPDRLGVAEGARWRIVRGSTQAASSSLLRRAGGVTTIVITRVVDGSLLAWHDTEFGLDAEVMVSPAASRHAEVRVRLEGSRMRILSEGLRSVPHQAVRRLYDLCQTAAEP
jgi:uncharacterized protein YndB with AHSA1/START domain